MARWLKPVRVAVALLVGAAFTAAFVDFRSLLPADAAHFLAAGQFTPALMAALDGSRVALAILALLALLALLFGRVYCSVLCPLGLLQDAAFRLAARGRRRPLRYAAAPTRVRYGILLCALALSLFGGAGIVAAWLDPYSTFGRAAASLVRPVVVAANNLLVPAVHELSGGAIYRVPVPWPALGVAAVAFAVIAPVVGLAAWRGRLYCNSVCPVGTLLGLLGKVAAFRPTVASGACTKCARCVRVCKAQCIDLRTATVDASRCVACFNCVQACEHGGIGFRFAWTAPLAAAPSAPRDPPRRAFLAAGLLAAPAAVLHAAQPTASPVAPPAPPVAPPGAHSVEQLLDRCTACQLCVSACPTQVLQPALFHYGWAGFAKPRLDFERAFCNFECRRCGEVCPTDAIALLELPVKKLTSVGVAKFERSLCIVDANGTDCAACSEHCPTKAVNTVPFRDNLRLPQVTEDLCIGCGACEFACPVRPKRAIVVEARAEHRPARRAEEAKPEFRRPANDFPF